MIFSEIAGHKDLAEMLKGMVQKGRMPHAMLFAEQSGCGALPLVLATVQFMFCRARKALAGGDEKWLLKGLFGDNPETAAPTEDSCEICSSCIKIRNLSHPDFHFVFPINTTQIVEKGKKASIDAYYEIFRDLVKQNPYFSEQDLYNAMELDNKMGLIGVSEASWLINRLSFSAYEGGDKVVLIMFPERMNLEAANKLLKSIEEPTEDTYFFLITNAPGKIIQTIRSRCRLIEVPPIENEALAKALEAKYKMDGEKAAMWASCAQGSFGRAIELIEESEAEKEDFEDLSSLIRLALDKDLPGLVNAGADLARRGKEAQKNFCRSALKLLRQIYVIKLGKEDIAYLNPNQKEEIEELSKKVKADSFEKLYEIFNDTIECIERNVNAKFIFSDLCNALYQNI
ncbi:MAG: hypothetical protein J6X91_07090 [Bacteroidales bacterium]|nr:hypothetical protein [Bacteroidales bacterium]MBP5518400.1 hypothetical protein [Bacteroidales bacterium]